MNNENKSSERGKNKNEGLFKAHIPDFQFTPPTPPTPPPTDDKPETIDSSDKKNE